MLNYEIQVYDEGIVITTPFPADHMNAAAKFAKAIGFDRMDIGVGQCLGGCFFTNEEGSALMRKAIDEKNAGLSPEDQWINSWDRGVSSETIFCFMTGRPRLYSRNDVPHDADDFGRCFRLLEKFPTWRARLPELAEAQPKWKGLVEHWAELEGLYRDVDKPGMGKTLSVRIQTLAD